jgi:hypothetical protein
MLYLINMNSKYFNYAQMTFINLLIKLFFYKYNIKKINDIICSYLA